MTKPLAEIRNYDDLHKALRRRADDVNISRLTLDHLAGLSDGHSGKILGAAKVKRLGPISFGSVLEALGLKLLLVEDAEQASRMCDRWKESAKRRAA